MSSHIDRPYTEEEQAELNELWLQTQIAYRRDAELDDDYPVQGVAVIFDRPDEMMRVMNLIAERMNAYEDYVAEPPPAFIYPGTFVYMDDRYALMLVTQLGAEGNTACDIAINVLKEHGIHHHWRHVPVLQ